MRALLVLLAAVTALHAQAAVAMPLACCDGEAAQLTAAGGCNHQCNTCSICHSPAVTPAAERSNIEKWSSPINNVAGAESTFAAEPFHRPPRS